MIRFKFSIYWFCVILILLSPACREKPQDEKSRTQKTKKQEQTLSQGERYLIDKLVYCARRGLKDRVIHFLDAGADINGFNNSDKTALMEAAHYGHTDVVRLLIKRGANIKAKTKNDADAMIWAAAEGHFEIVKLLIEHGEDVSIVNSRNQRLLYHASTDDSPEILNLLLSNGLQVKSMYPKGYDGPTATHAAAEYCGAGILKILIREGAPIDIQEKYEGDTPLIRAASENCTEAIITLLDLGADVGKTSHNGTFILGAATHRGNVTAVEYLLKYGADSKYKNKFGMTALDMAIKQAAIFKSRNAEYDKIIKLLKENMKELRDLGRTQPANEAKSQNTCSSNGLKMNILPTKSSF